MYIFSKQIQNNSEYFPGRVLVSYVSADKPSACEIEDRLLQAGIRFYESEKNAQLCAKDGYGTHFRSCAKICDVAILLIGKSLFLPENASMRRMFWYEVGYLTVSARKMLLFFTDIDRSERSEYLYRTPVRQIQGTDSIEELLAQITQTNQDPVFYADSQVNKFAFSRIDFAKITVVFNIYKKDVEKMQAFLARIDEDMTQQEILDQFLQEISFGTKVVSFNQEQKLGAEFDLYREEVHTLVKDYPINYAYAKPHLLENSMQNEVVAAIRADFVFPVHTLLGVDFKAFVELPRHSRFKTEHLQDFLLSNLPQENARDSADLYMDKSNHRLYFLLDLPDTHEDSHCGTRVNYLWPR